MATDNKHFDDDRSRHRPSASVFVINAHFLDRDGRMKTKPIYKTESAQYENDIKRFIADEGIFSRLDDFATEKGINPESMYAVSVRHGNYGTAVVMELKEVRLP